MLLCRRRDGLARHRRPGDHSNFGNEMAGIIAGALRGTKDSILEAVEAFRDLRADEVILNPAVDDLDEVSRLADIVL